MSRKLVAVIPAPPSRKDRIQAKLQVLLRKRFAEPGENPEDVGAQYGRTVAVLKDFIPALFKAIESGDPDDVLAIRDPSKRYAVSQACTVLPDLVGYLIKLHGTAASEVEEEDAAAERARLEVIAAQQKAAADKEARRQRFEELKALEAEFGGKAE